MAAKKTAAATKEPTGGVNDRQRRFCEFVMRGMPAGRAYERAGYEARGDAADAAAARMLGNAKVSGYLQSLRDDAAEVAGKDRDDLVKRLWEIVETPVGEINANHPLCQEWAMDESGSIRVKMPNKIAAGQLLSTIMGWNKPQEVKVEAGDKLADIIRRIRAR